MICAVIRFSKWWIDLHFFPLHFFAIANALVTLESGFYFLTRLSSHSLVKKLLFLKRLVRVRTKCWQTSMSSRRMKSCMWNQNAVIICRCIFFHRFLIIDSFFKKKSPPSAVFQSALALHKRRTFAICRCRAGWVAGCQSSYSKFVESFI